MCDIQDLTLVSTLPMQYVIYMIINITMVSKVIMR